MRSTFIHAHWYIESFIWFDKGQHVHCFRKISVQDGTSLEDEEDVFGLVALAVEYVLFE